MIKPFEPHKIDQGFGNPTSYGPHEGWDMNGLGGGNTDCGYSLKAVGDGEIVHTSEKTTDYGKLVVLHVKTNLGDRWVRYCHCQQILVTSGQVASGDVLALMGSSGNSTACHLHFDVLKKKPSNWRFYAKTLNELNEWFENPSEFFNLENVIIQPEDMPKWLKDLVVENGQNSDNFEGWFRETLGKAKDYEGLKKTVDKQAESIKKLTDRLLEQEGEIQTLTRNRVEDFKKIEKLQEQLASGEPQFSNSLAQWFYALAKKLG